MISGRSFGRNSANFEYRTVLLSAGYINRTHDARNVGTVMAAYGVEFALSRVTSQWLFSQADGN